MHTVSLFDRSPYVQTAEPIIQQPDQVRYPQVPLVSYWIPGLFPLLVLCLYIIVTFSCLSVALIRDHNKRYARTETRLQRLQTLERIWQMTAKRRD